MLRVVCMTGWSKSHLVSLARYVLLHRRAAFTLQVLDGAITLSLRYVTLRLLRPICLGTSKPFSDC